MKARALIPDPYAGMNKTEKAYAQDLELRRLAHEIESWRFERVTLRLGKDGRTTYTPDFLVIGVGGEQTFHEVKGFWRDDARVKIKVAAHQFPEYNFVAAQKRPKREGGGWKIEEF